MSSNERGTRIRRFHFKPRPFSNAKTGRYCSVKMDLSVPPRSAHTGICCCCRLSGIGSKAAAPLRLERRAMKMRIFAVLLVLLSGLYCSAQTSGVEGEWQGIKNTPERVIFTGEVTLQSGASCKTCAATSDGSIQGKIVWGLRSAGMKAAPGMAGKAGKIGTEY